jgi:hypothetical protein
LRETRTFELEREREIYHSNMEVSENGGTLKSSKI